MTNNEYKDLVAELDAYMKKNDKHLKGYVFDSLVYRYKLARHRMSEMEQAEDLKCGKQKDIDHYKWLEDRDVMRFIEILDEAIGEHD